jgi:hypothetical protein
MKLVLVNGRTPCSKSLCLECCELIGAGYLREFGTRQPYCDYDCYAAHPGNAASYVFEDRVRASSLAALYRKRSVQFQSPNRVA